MKAQKNIFLTVTKFFYIMTIFDIVIMEISLKAKPTNLIEIQPPNPLYKAITSDVDELGG